MFCRLSTVVSPQSLLSACDLRPVRRAVESSVQEVLGGVFIFKLCLPKNFKYIQKDREQHNKLSCVYGFALTVIYSIPICVSIISPPTLPL